MYNHKDNDPDGERCLPHLQGGEGDTELSRPAGPVSHDFIVHLFCLLTVL